MKTCKTCKEVKSENGFWKQSRNKNLLRPSCKKYMNKAVVRNRKPGHNWKRKYNITREEYRLQSKKQNNLCRICGKKPNTALHIDHIGEIYKNAIVRGLICGPCNRGLGLFYDNPETLRSAANYLEQFNNRLS